MATNGPVAPNTEAELTSIFSAQPQFQQPSLLQTILSQIANAAVVATAKDPSATLQAQQQNAQANQQRRQNIQLAQQQALQQFKLQDLANRIAEGRKVQQEKRAEEATIRSEGRANERTIEDFKRQSGLAKELKGIDFQNQFKLAKFNAAANADIAEMNNQAAVNLEQLRSSNDSEERRVAAFYSFATPLIYGQMPGEQAARITVKLQNGEEPDAEDLQALRKAQQNYEKYELRKIATAHRASTAGQPLSGAKLDQELKKAALQRAATEEMALVRNAQGQPQLIPYRTGGLLNEPILPPGSKFERLANYDEKANYFLDLNKRIYGAGFDSPVTQTSEGGDTEVKVKDFENQIEQYRKTNPNIGTAQIIQKLNDAAQRSPADAAAIKIVLDRLGNNAQGGTDARANNPDYEVIGKDPQGNPLYQLKRGKGLSGVGESLKKFFNPKTPPDQVPNY